jgi:hypothetical protein
MVRDKTYQDSRASDNYQYGITHFDKNIDAHGLKIQGRGYGMFLPKFLEGFKGFRKNCQGGTPILRFIAFLLTSFLKILRGVLFHTPPPPLPPPPLCASMVKKEKDS